MVGMRRISGAGRGLLVLGAGLLLVSLLGSLLYPASEYFTWFTISGNRMDLVAGTYSGIQATQLLNSLLTVPIVWIAYAWFFVCAIAALAVAGMGRRTHNFGTSGIILLLLYAAALFLDAYVLNQQTPTETATITIGYGFVAAIVASALIEAGGRLPSAVPTRPAIPTGALGREKA